jgi:hypothetical protein
MDTHRNRIDWPLMSELDDYIDARSNAEKIVARIKELRESMAVVSSALNQTPNKALSQLPAVWPDASELRDLVQQAANAFANMQSRWKVLPEDRRRHAMPPIQDMSGARTGRV